MARVSTAGKKRVKFQIKAESGKKVMLAGTFNNWNPEESKLKEKGKTGVYSLELSLPKGRYEYKFVIDDVWCVDPECPEWVPNNYGSLNSVLTVA
jgi:1,4-alpha-glucan branching enzyme